MALSRRPKLGQHFLRDPAYCHRIVEELPVSQKDVVVEIGAGQGAMTELLADRARRVLAVEIDPALASKLHATFDTCDRVTIINGDILTTDLLELSRQYGAQECVVAGNVPYYITSPILHHMFAFRTCIRGMGLLVQREVAERITAKPGNREYGYLTVMSQMCWRPRVALTVPPGAFSPPPKVHSAFVAFSNKPPSPPTSSDNVDRFLAFVRSCFAQKRKSLPNNLGRVYPRARICSALEALGKSKHARAEELPVEELAELFNNLQCRDLLESAPRS